MFIIVTGLTHLCHRETVLTAWRSHINVRLLRRRLLAMTVYIIDRCVTPVVILFITFIYLLTLPQAIGLGDSGLLAGAAASLGVPHPPGFPSYVLLGHLFTALPWGSVAWRLGLISVFSSLGTIWIVMRLAGLPAALFLAFSYSFWSQAVNVETYAATNLVILLVAFFALQEKPKWWLIGMIGGIGLGLSPIVVAVLPGILVIARSQRRRSNLTVRDCFAALAMTLLGAVGVYSYLPIRAAAHPFLNWSDPSTIDRFIKHVTGGGLSIATSTAVNGFTGSLTWYVDAWVRFGYLLFVNYLGIGLVIAGLGAYVLYKRDKTIFWFWILLVFTNVSLAGLYTSGNRDSWFVTSFIAGAVFLGEGMGFVIARSLTTKQSHGDMRSRRRRNGLAMTLCALPLIVWFPLMRERATSTFTQAPSDGAGFTTDYTRDLYRDLPQNALLLGGGETFNALTVYAHEALKLRPDVTPIDFTIFYGQEWYRNNMALSFPRTRESREEKAGSPIRSGMTVTVDMPKFADEMEFTRILEQFVAANSNRPVFVTGYLLRQPVYGGAMTPAYVPQKYALEQHGIVYRVIARSTFDKLSVNSATRQSPPQTEIASPFERSRNDKEMYLESNYQKAIDLIRMEYALGLEMEGIQLLQDGNQTQAFDRFTRAGEIAPLYFDQNRLGEIIKSIQTATPSSVPKER